MHCIFRVISFCFSENLTRGNFEFEKEKSLQIASSNLRLAYYSFSYDTTSNLQEFLLIRTSCMTFNSTIYHYRNDMWYMVFTQVMAESLVSFHYDPFFDSHNNTFKYSNMDLLHNRPRENRVKRKDFENINERVPAV